MDEIADAVRSVAAAHGCTPAQVALAAVRQEARFGSIIPIIGASSPTQLKDSLGCLDLTLPAEDLIRLQAVSKITHGFPHDLINSPIMRGYAHAGQHELLDNHRAIKD